MSESPSTYNIIQKIIFSIAILFCLSPWASAPLGLLLGLIVSQTIGNPFQHYNYKNSFTGLHCWTRVWDELI